MNNEQFEPLIFEQIRLRHEFCACSYVMHVMMHVMMQVMVQVMVQVMMKNPSQVLISPLHSSSSVVCVENTTTIM